MRRDERAAHTSRTRRATRAWQGKGARYPSGSALHCDRHSVDGAHGLPRFVVPQAGLGHDDLLHRAGDVELVVRDVEPVGRVPRHDPRRGGAERGPEPRHEHLERGLGMDREMVGPDVLDQPSRADVAVGVEGQDREQGALPGRGDLVPGVVDGDTHIAQHPQPQHK